MASLEGETPIKQCITILEKKLRNLEKRKAKLDGYKTKAKEGFILDKDQQEAVSKYDQVVQNLEFARELQKQFQLINTETEKALRKQTKRDKIERQNHEISRLKDVLKFQNVFKCLGDEATREGFKSGKWSDISLTEEQLRNLDCFSEITVMSRQNPQAAEHLYLLSEKCEKVAFGEVTYKDVVLLVENIASSCFFEKDPVQDTCEVEEATTGAATTLSESQQVNDQQQSQLNGAIDDSKHLSANGFDVTSEAMEKTVLGCGSSENGVMHVVENGTNYNNSEGAFNQQLQQNLNQPMEDLQLTAVVHSQSSAVPQGLMLGGHWASSDPLVQPQHMAVNEPAYAPPLSTHMTISYLGASNYDRPRPLRDIVSSIQGRYNFLQESLIENVENQNNLNNNSVVDVPAMNEAIVSSPSSLQQQLIDHHHLQQQDHHQQQLPMATIAGSQASGFTTVYHNQLHPHHQLLHHHHDTQPLGMPTSVQGDVYFPQQQMYQRVPPNVYDRSNQSVPDMLETKQLQQVPPNIPTSSSIGYSSFHSMQLPENSGNDPPGFLIGSVPVAVSSYQQQPQHQLENSKGSYTMNPNANIFRSGFHTANQSDVSLATENPDDQSQNGKVVRADEQKEVGSKTFAQTASGGKPYQEFTNTQNQRGQKPGSQYQRYPNSGHPRSSFNTRPGNAPPYNNNNPPRGAGVSYRGGARFGGPGGTRPPNQGGNFYQRNEHFHQQMNA